MSFKRGSPVDSQSRQYCVCLVAAGVAITLAHSLGHSASEVHDCALSAQSIVSKDHRNTLSAPFLVTTKPCSPDLPRKTLDFTSTLCGKGMSEGGGGVTHNLINGLWIKMLMVCCLECDE